MRRTNMSILIASVAVFAGGCLLTQSWQRHASTELAMLKAIENGDVASVSRQLTEVSPSIRLTRLVDSAPFAGTHAEDIRGMPAISYAISSEEREIARLLLRTGADPNATDAGGKTPLMYAVMIGDQQLIELLVAKGANPSAQDSLGETAFHHAVIAHDPASSLGPRLITQLAKLGLNPNASGGPNGESPLMMAVRYGHLELTRALLEIGARAEQPATNGETPLSVALKLGDSRLVRALQRGVN